MNFAVARKRLIQRAGTIRPMSLRKLKYGALALPLVAFVAIMFVFPIGSMFKYAVDNAQVSETFASTSKALKDWDGQKVPQAAAFDALAKDLARAKDQGILAGAAQRLNYQEPGFRSLLLRTARQLSEQANEDAKLRLSEIDGRWTDAATWRFLRQSTMRLTSFYFLSSLDLRLDSRGNLARVPEDNAVFIDVFARTIYLGISITVVCLALGFPLAYFIVSQSPRVQRRLMMFVLLPFWTSLIVRCAAWIVLLQNDGIVNQTLRALRLTDSPVQLVFNRTGVVVAMVHIMLPFMILPIYSVMKSIPPEYMKAALSLGGSRMRSFVKVYLPLTLPGMAAGTVLVFVMAIGYYITPALLGGEHDQMISYFIGYFATQSMNWGMASALACILLAVTIALYVVYARLTQSKVR
jgi:putative spermidine/putrescine transport system permease protein